MTSETLRDTFAAAALTGLIASREWPIDSDEAAHYCYRVADAMLRERCRATADCPLPDNAPHALTDAEREAVRFCVTASLPETEKLGGVAGELCRMHAATLRGLLERLK